MASLLPVLSSLRWTERVSTVPLLVGDWFSTCYAELSFLIPRQNTVQHTILSHHPSSPYSPPSFLTLQSSILHHTMSHHLSLPYIPTYYTTPCHAILPHPTVQHITPHHAFSHHSTAHTLPHHHTIPYLVTVQSPVLVSCFFIHIYLLNKVEPRLTSFRMGVWCFF